MGFFKAIYFITVYFSGLIEPIYFSGNRSSSLCSLGRRQVRQLGPNSLMLPVISEGGRMAGRSERKTMLVGLILALVLGIAVYLKLWTIDYTLSSDDTERLRRQFDLANREAMDESAEWRRMFDKEAEKTSKCNTELAKIKESSGNGNTFAFNQKVESLKKENADLLSKIDTLKQELEISRAKCRSRQAPS